jgi:hypothetical protein
VVTKNNGDEVRGGGAGVILSTRCAVAVALRDLHKFVPTILGQLSYVTYVILSYAIILQ